MNNRHPVEDDKALGRLMADIRKAPLRVRDGYGYWDTTAYPVGGNFRRADSCGPVIVRVLRTFRNFHGANMEGETADGRRVACDMAHTEAVPNAN